MTSINNFMIIVIITTVGLVAVGGILAKGAALGLVILFGSQELTIILGLIIATLGWIPILVFHFLGGRPYNRQLAGGEKK
jgi:hypothetical protein